MLGGYLPCDGIGISVGEHIITSQTTLRRCLSRLASGDIIHFGYGSMMSSIFLAVYPTYLPTAYTMIYPLLRPETLLCRKSKINKLELRSKKERRNRAQKLHIVHSPCQQREKASRLMHRRVTPSTAWYLQMIDKLSNHTAIQDPGPCFRFAMPDKTFIAYTTDRY